MEELRFFIERRGKVAGPVTDDELRDAIRAGKLESNARVRLAGTDLWASPRSFLALARTPGLAPPPVPQVPSSSESPRVETTQSQADTVKARAQLASLSPSVKDALLFWVADGAPGSSIVGPISGAALRASLEAGTWEGARVALVDTEAWAPAAAVFGLAAPWDRSAVPASDQAAPELALEAAVKATPEPAAPSEPSRRTLRDGEVAPVRREAGVAVQQTARPVRTILLGAMTSAPGALPRCPTCLEQIPTKVETCPECGETTSAAPASRGPSSISGVPSIPDDLPGATVLQMHWRPMVTLGAIVGLVCTGVALRYLAPAIDTGSSRGAVALAGGGSRSPSSADSPAGATGATARYGKTRTGGAANQTTCSASCWTGEACEAGQCVWHAPNDVGHVGLLADARRAVPPTPPGQTHPSPASPASPASPSGASSSAGTANVTIGGPFALPRDVSDVLPLDGERFAVGLLTGLQVHNARTGGVLSLVTDAPQTRHLYRVGSVVYATAPQRIYVVDAETTSILKTIEVGSPIGALTLGASGRRVLVSLPSAHSVAVLATEFHAEIDRIQFGDDAVSPVGADDTGKRALTTTGQIPLPGLPQIEPRGGGAVYAFDPSRLASAQDRVRASMVGNAVSVLMTPDGTNSYVVLRAEDAIVPLEWQPSGALRQEARIPTCREPEQIELVRRGRLGVVRCNEGRAIEVFDLEKRALLKHVPFNGRVADVAVSPDGKQAIVALPADGAGFVGLVDLESWEVKLLPVNAEPTRVRLSPDGSIALVLSDRAKVAWVLR